MLIRLSKSNDAVSGAMNQPTAKPPLNTANEASAISRLPAGPAAAMTAARIRSRNRYRPWACLGNAEMLIIGAKALSRLPRAGTGPGGLSAR
jgi:hypothetical protein